MIRKYCKAYYLKDLRQFGAWTEKGEESDAVPTDESVVYLWDDFVVVRSPVLPGGVIFDDVTQQWQDFCHTTLVEGTLTLNYVKVRCVADINLETLNGAGHLVILEEVHP